MTPKYPYAEIKQHKTKTDVLYFHLHLQQGAMVCISLQGERTIIRRILNPHHTSAVIIYQNSAKTSSGVGVYVSSGIYEEIETLEYRNGALHYHNQHIVWKIPFSEHNRKSLENYDFQLEERSLNGMCCALY